MLLPFAFGASVCSPREFVEVKIRELVTLGSLDTRRLLWRLRPFVATWELPILLWVVCLKIVVKAPDSTLKDSDSGR